MENTNLTHMVKKLLADSDGALSLGEIYDIVEESGVLTDFQREFDEWEPRFRHEIRAVINQLLCNGEIVRVDRGKYKNVQNQRNVFD
jgi:hypothetical protein